VIATLRGVRANKIVGVHRISMQGKHLSRQRMMLGHAKGAENTKF
jgi:hypothetical protein